MGIGFVQNIYGNPNWVLFYYVSPAALLIINFKIMQNYWTYGNLQLLICLQASSAVKKRSFNLADGNLLSWSILLLHLIDIWILRFSSGSNAKSNSAAQYTGGNHSASVPGKPVVPMPTTSLNIGMDLWNASPAGGTPMKTRPQSSGASPQVASATIVGREGMLQDHQWIQVWNVSVISLDSIVIVFILYRFCNLFMHFLS